MTATIAAAPPPVGGQMSLELTASADRARSLPRLESNRDRFDHFAENPAKQLAWSLVDRFVLVSGAGFLAPVARRWKTQLNFDVQPVEFGTLPRYQVKARRFHDRRGLK